MPAAPRAPTAAAIVLAGGSGSRVGAADNKVYLPLAGRPMVVWSLSTFAAVPGIGPVLLVVRAVDRERAERLLTGDPGLAAAGVQLVVGGRTRQESELAGLRALAEPIRAGTVDVVLLHDGARPLVSPALVVAVRDTARAVGGAVPGLPRTDLAQAAGTDSGTDSGAVAGPAPADLVGVQTPQGFRAGPLLAAYEAAQRGGFAGTDTASCMQRFAPEVPIRAIAGEAANFKVTYSHDLPAAEHLLARFRC